MSHMEGVEGRWKITNYSQHPECAGYTFNIQPDGQNTYSLSTYVINSIGCKLEYNPTTNQWKTSNGISTLMGGSPEEMQREHLINQLIDNIQNLEVQDQEHLIIKTNNGEEVQFERV